MTIITVLAILLALGMIAALAVDLRDRRRGTKRGPMPSRGDLEGKAIGLHNPPIQP